MGRPGLEDALSFVQAGEVLVVWRLDRLGRSLKHLIDIINELETHDVGFCSLMEGMDTTTNGGKLIFNIFGALAEFERGLILERTQAGLRSARAQGRLGGRPKKLDTKGVELAKTLMNSNEHSVKDACHILGITKSTLYRYLKSG